jgi:hypothetical protein
LKQQLKQVKKENSDLSAEVGKLSVENDNKDKELAKKDEELHNIKKELEKAKTELAHSLHQNRENILSPTPEEEQKLFESSDRESENEEEIVSDASSGIINTKFLGTLENYSTKKEVKNEYKKRKYKQLLEEISDPNKKLEDLPADYLDIRQREMGIFFSPKKQKILLEQLKERRNSLKNKGKQV